MKLELKTLVVDYNTGDRRSPSGVSFVLDTKLIDAAYGENVSLFYEEEKMWALAILSEGVRIVSHACSSGVLTNLGPVVRTEEALVPFDFIYEENVHDADTLSPPPIEGSVLTEWHGNVAQLHIEGAELRAIGGSIPAIGTFTYQYEAISYEFTPPADLSSGREDEVFPVLLVLYVEDII